MNEGLNKNLTKEIQEAIDYVQEKMQEADSNNDWEMSELIRIRTGLAEGKILPHDAKKEAFKIVETKNFNTF